MIYVTGDIHGDLKRFKNKKLNKLKKGDSLFVCGDFGFIWTGSKKEQKTLKKIGKMKYNVLFVEGCHENYDLLYNYPTEDWNGGKVRQIYGKLKHLVRGSIFEIDGVKVFAFGGGHGTDHDIRKVVKTCWEQELPTDEELQLAFDNLEKSNNQVDYIITHEPPAMLGIYLEAEDETLKTNHLNAAFNQISDKCTYKRWVFGKCHKNKVVSSHFQAIFSDIIKLETPKPEKKKKLKKSEK